MTARPKTVPTWATDENYDEPLEAWHGTPTKVEPTTERQAEGWRPAARPPATYENWRANAVGAWLAFLANVAIANWRRVRLFKDPTTEVWGNNDADLRCGVYVPDSNGGRGDVFVFGEVDSASSNALAAVTYGTFGSTAWETEQVDTSSPANILACCHDTSNDLVQACGSGGLIYSRPQASSAGSGVWTQRSSAAGVDLRAIAHGTGDGVGTPRLIAVGEDTASDDMRIYSSVNGTAWTLRGSVTDRPMYGVANKPGAMWVAVGDDNAGAAAIYRSADGITWTASTAPAIASLRHVVWEARAERFFAVGLNGARATSPDGITWTDQTDTGTAWADADPAGMATDDAGTILVLAPRVGTLNDGPFGGSVYASTDGGITFTDAYVLNGGGLGTIRNVFWAGPHGWVVTEDTGSGTDGPGVQASLVL